MRMNRSILLAAAAAIAVTACETTGAPEDAAAAEAASAEPSYLETVVASRSEEDKARDQWRHPAETLAFFGIEPGMSVIEALPGGGWYSRVIIPAIGPEGRYIGANYAYDMYPRILPNPNEEMLARLKAWPETFPARAAEWGAGDDMVAYSFGGAPAELEGTVDAALFIRALHNFNRAGGDFAKIALEETYRMLKPGGVLGVVQHAAPEGAEGAAADGTTGYMSKDVVIAMAEAAGFVLDGESDINANPADVPAADEIVWRLPPTLGMGETNREAYLAIGESNRMTLRFVKPE